jgi:hypothetical protein
VECRFQHDFLRRIALRLVKARRRLGLAKHIGHAVVTNPFAGTKIRVRVVVKRAPADAARILRIGGKLVIVKKYSGKGVDQKFTLLPDDTSLIADGADTTPVIFINEATARALFTNVDPIGQRIQPWMP